MKTYFKFVLIVISFFSFFNSCKEKPDSKSSFHLIPRNSYFTDIHQGIEVYRLNDTRKPMNGYYVIGNEDKKWEEFNVENGVLNGDYIIYHSNGKKFIHSKYVKGKKHGEEKMYYQSGSIKGLKTYSRGSLYGKNIGYFESGQIQSESKIENEKTIESITYDNIGNIKSQMFIKDGRTIEQAIRSGKVVSEFISSNYDDFEAMKFYDETGKLTLFLRMLVEGERGYIIELDEQENEIKRIDIKSNPQEAMKYQQYLMRF